MSRKTLAGSFVVLLLVFMPTVYASAQQNCFSYETDGVRLTGTLSKKTFPGPPNYESIRKGDQPETYWILHLTRPICVAAGADDAAESGVKDVQLILTQKQYALYKGFVGPRVRVTLMGKLSHAITGHHHTPVLMEVATISSGLKR
jgi:hypothetical protein